MVLLRPGASDGVVLHAVGVNGCQIVARGRVVGGWRLRGKTRGCGPFVVKLRLYRKGATPRRSTPKCAPLIVKRGAGSLRVGASESGQLAGYPGV